MAKTRCEINGKVFETKKQLQEHIQGILKNAKLNEILDEETFQFAYAILQGHENAERKIGCGVRVIRVREVPTIKNRYFEIERIDGTTEDFSYLKAIGSLSHLTNLKKAFRNIIDAQTQAFKKAAFKKGCAVCELSGETLSNSRRAHVDHAAPMTFDRLLFDFLKARNLRTSDIQLGGYPVRELVDKDLEIDWYIFHGENAKLRILSKRENLAQSKEKINWNEVA